MKNKFYVLLVFVILTFSMFSCTFALTLSDVKGTKYENSVNNLTDLKVINGYEDQTFKPTKTITRAEMAKVLVTALGKQDMVNTKTTTQIFSDVPTTHWSAGYIEVASSLNLIKGYPEGTFKPENPVSYVEGVTMMLRALNYNKEMESYSWPDGYIKKASEIKMLSGVVYNTPNDSAIRGDIANMMWNTLNSYTQKIVSENSAGVVYGNDVLLLEKSFPNNYLSMKDSVIVDVDLDDSTITVEINGKEKEIEYSDASETELKKMFGRTIEKALYDSKNKRFISLELNSDEKVVTGNVKKVSKDQVYIGSTGYDIPTKNAYIKLIGISNVEDAEKAYIVMYGSKVKYMLLEGEETLNIGLVSSYTAATSKKLASVEMVTLEDGDYETFDVVGSTKLHKGDVLIYGLNSDDEVVIKKAVSIDDSKAITLFTKASSSTSNAYVQLKGESKVTLSKDVDYVAVKVDLDDEEITEISLTKSTAMDIDEDTAVFVKVNNVKYLVVFEYGADYDGDEDEDKVGTLKEELAKLKPYMVTTSNKIYKAYNGKDGKTYTSATFSAFEDAYEAAETLYNNGSPKSSTTATKLYNARTTLESKYNKLKVQTTADKTLETAKSNLKTKITTAEKLYADTTYTQATRDALKKAIDTAKPVSTSSSATLEKVQAQLNNLDTAIAALRTDDSQSTVAQIKKDFKDALADAKKIVDDKSNYVNYTKLVNHYDACKDFNVDSTSTLDLVEWTKTLKNDMENIETKDYQTLGNTISEAENKNKDLNDSDLALEIKTAKSVYNSADALTYKESGNVLSNLRKALEKATKAQEIGKAEDALSSLIDKAEALLETFEKNEMTEEASKLSSAISSAETALKASNRTQSTLDSAYDKLNAVYKELKDVRIPEKTEVEEQ